MNYTWLSREEIENFSNSAVTTDSLNTGSKRNTKKENSQVEPQKPRVRELRRCKLVFNATIQENPASGTALLDKFTTELSTLAHVTRCQWF